MTRKQLISKRRTRPTVKSVVRDASGLDRDSLLELRTIIDQLLEAQGSLEAAALQREPEPQQAITEEMDIEPLALLKQGVDVWNEWREHNPEVNRPPARIKKHVPVRSSATQQLDLSVSQSVFYDCDNVLKKCGKS